MASLFCNIIKTMKQFALFYNSNSETYWHIIEHLIGAILDDYWYTNANTGTRYCRFVVNSNKVSLKTIVKSLDKRQFAKTVIAKELMAIRKEYEEDGKRPSFDLKYRALFGLSYAEMFKKQMAIISDFKITAKEIIPLILQLQPLNKKDDIKTITNFVSNQTPKRYLDPKLKLKSHIIFRNDDFAFVKRCKDLTDAKATKFLLYELEYQNVLSNLHYYGIIDKHLLITGTLTKKAAKKKLEQLQKPQSLDILPPLGRSNKRSLIDKVELNLAFPNDASLSEPS